MTEFTISYPIIVMGGVLWTAAVCWLVYYISKGFK